VIRYCIEHC